MISRPYGPGIIGSWFGTLLSAGSCFLSLGAVLGAVSPFGKTTMATLAFLMLAISASGLAFGSRGIERSLAGVPAAKATAWSIVAGFGSAYGSLMIMAETSARIRDAW